MVLCILCGAKEVEKERKRLVVISRVDTFFHVEQSR